MTHSPLGVSCRYQLSRTRPYPRKKASASSDLAPRSVPMSSRSSHSLPANTGKARTTMCMTKPSFALIESPSGHLANQRGDAPRPLLAPARQAGGPAPGPSARADDEEIVGILEQRAQRGLVRGRHLAGHARGALPVGDHAARVGHEELLHPALRPLVLTEDLAVLAGEDEQGLVEALHVGDAEIAERVGEAPQQWLGRGGELVVHLVEAVRGIDGHGALLGPEAALDVQRLPRVILLVLGEAEGVLPGIAEGGAVKQARPRLHDVHHHQAHRATD